MKLHFGHFFPVQKLIFGHFWNCKIWNLAKKNFMKLIYLISQVFLARTFLIFQEDRSESFCKSLGKLLQNHLGQYLCKQIYYKTYFNMPQRAKNLVKSNKSISRNFVLTKFHFLQFEKRANIYFWTGEKFKTAKNAISHKKFFIYLISRVFFGWT